MKPRMKCWIVAGVLTAAATAAATASHRLQSSVVGAGGAPSSSSQWSANGTLGQSTPIGRGTSPGAEVDAGFWEVWVTVTPTGVVAAPEPQANRLEQNFPNPFNPSTTIRYAVAEAGEVSIRIFNVRGQLVKRLVEQHRAPGRYAVTWDGLNEQEQRVATGVYFYRIRAGAFTDVKKMIVLK